MSAEAPRIELTDGDRAQLAGDDGDACRMAMSILVTMTEVLGGERLLDIRGAHIDGCLYHGDSGIDFAEKLLDGGARVRVPTTLNVGGFDLLHPENFQGSPERARQARRLMECYQEMGCQPIWTCAPYHAAPRPSLGEQVAWAESNAIVFANSVLGARTHRYGDFLDICAAITGRAPAVGLHLDENRRATVVCRLEGLPEKLLSHDVLYPVLGYWLGETVGTEVPVLVGLPRDATEDQLKSLGAAAASSGALALFHAVGVTPEAETLEQALHGRRPEREIVVGLDELVEVRDRLSTVEAVEGGALSVVALGSPHFSIEECERLADLVGQHPPDPRVELVVCTHRVALAVLERRGVARRLLEAGVRIVVDTCVVVAPIVRAAAGGVLMTNSGKFAHYTPGNIGFDVVYGSLEECVRSAACGEIWRDPDLWQ